ncbi:MAG: hypothetical protein IPK82_29885 [Polyangiaceae bacterium]|nr:hypothetical protein [Polyangiaceae bacterium]
MKTHIPRGEAVRTLPVAVQRWPRLKYACSLSGVLLIPWVAACGAQQNAKTPDDLAARANAVVSGIAAVSTGTAPKTNESATEGEKKRETAPCDAGKSKERTRALLQVLSKNKQAAQEARTQSAEGKLKDARETLAPVKTYLNLDLNQTSDPDTQTARADLKKADPELCVDDHKGVIDAIGDAVLEAEKAKEEIKKASEICQSGAHCLYVGAYLANASFAWATLDTNHGGAAGHALISAALPVAGYRYAWKKDYLWLEVGLGSMIASEDLSARNEDAKPGCRTGTNQLFEDRLPCEANADLTPLIFAYPAVTLGKSDVGFLTIMPMFGFAKTSLDGGIYPFFAMSIGTLSYTKAFVIKPGE